MSKILAQGMITLTQLYEGAQVILTPAAVLIPCDSNETPKPNAYINASTNVKAFLGTMDITSGITLGELEYSDSTVRASKTGTKVSITTITTRTGYVDIPVSATIDGETIDLGKHRFSFVKQIDGQTGQPGIQGDPGFSYTLNIKGGTRGIAYAANGTNPEPNTSSQFSVELLKNGVKVSNPASISWTCGGNLSGSSSAATFTPTIKSMYTSGSSYVKVSVKEFAASLAVEETIPIVCTKHADGLDWINEWNDKYVQVGTEKIITPKIFAGTKNSANELTGVAIGRDVLGGSPNKVIGIVGYKENTPVFSLDQDANFFVSSSGSPGDVKNGTNNAKGLYFDGNDLYISGRVRINGGSTIGENNTSVEEVINNSNLGAQANNKLDNLSIGGRNLVKGTAEPFVVTHTELNKITSKGLHLSSYLQNNKNIIRNKYITFSIDVKTTNLVYGTTNPWVGFELYVQGNTNQWLGIGGTRIKAGTSDGFVRYVHTAKVNDMDITGLSLQTLARDCTGTVELVRWQIEIGSKASDWTPAPEDVDSNINDVKNSLSNFQTTVNTTFKDGIIEEAEAKAIAQHLKTLEAEKADINKEYSTIYSNANLTGVAKTNLSSAKTSYDSAHTSLKSTINTVISDGRVSSSESASVTSAFNTYNTQLGTYKQKVQEALDAISSAKVNNIEIGGRNLFLNSGFTKGLNYWYTYNCSNPQAVADSSALSGYAVKFTSTGGGIYQRKGGASNNPTNYPNGSIMTVSGYVKSSVAGKVLRPNFENGGTNTSKNITCTNADTWYYFTHTHEIASNGFSTVTFYGDSGADYYLKDLMLEYGNKASTWTLAPEDVAANIDTAKNEAINSANNTLTTTIANYYTKEQTNSQIDIAKEAINLGVSNTYETKANVETKVNNAVNNIQIGGRNLAASTNQGTTGWHWGLHSGGKTISEVTENGIKCCKMVRDNVASTGWSYIAYTKIGREKYLPSKQYTVSFEVKSSVATSFLCSLRQGDSTNPLNVSDVKATVSKANTWTKLSFTLTTKDTLPTSTTQCVYLSEMSSATGVSYMFRNLMIEEGTKASSWTPAPEDVQVNIDKKANSADVYTKSEVYTKEEANSQINIAKDQINLNVSNTYETKANVESKVNNAVNNLQVGGRNHFKKKGEYGNNTFNDDYECVLSDYANATQCFTQFRNLDCPMSDFKGKEITISFWAKSPKGGTQMQIYNTNGTPMYPFTSFFVTVTTEWQRFHKTVPVTYNENGSDTNSNKIEFWATSFNGVIIKKVQVELGNKVSDWSPSPADVDTTLSTKANSSDVYTKSEVYTKSQTDSAINVAKDAINLGVSQTYETKSNVTSQIATAKSQAITDSRKVQDTRNTNESPIWYFTNYPSQTITEFKYANVIGIGTSSIYGTLETKVPWANSSGGYPVQIFRSQGTATYERKGTSDTTWSAWVEVESTTGSQAKANAVQTNLDAFKGTVYTKSEVYTKTETNSQISATTSAITSRVSSLESKEVANRKVTAFRYVRDSLKGSTANAGNHWVELQVWENGSNIAQGKTVTTNGTVYSDYPINRFTDGNISTSQYASVVDGGWKYLQVDLGEIHYNIDYLRVWHYYDDSRRYNHKLEVSVDGSTWYTIYNSDISGTYKETADGRVHIINETSTEKRLKTAESKITDSAIINTVSSTIQNAKNEAINSANSSTDNKLQNYATTSSLTQTADSITAKFTSTGGQNLLKNSDAKNGQYMWTGNGVTLTIGTSGANPFFGGNEFKSTFPNGLKYSESIKLKANTDYVYEGWIYCGMSFKGSGVTPLHYWCMDRPDTAGQAQLEVLDYRQDVTANVFNKCYVHFRTKSGNVYFTPFVYGGPQGEMVAVRQLSLTEGKVETAWTPHPSEIYEGSTVIDASGVTVNNGALRVKNNSGQTVLSGDSEGNLWVQNTLTVGGNNNGSVFIKNSSGTPIFSANKNGTFIKDGTMKISSGNITTSGTGYPDGNTRDMTIHSYGLDIYEVDYIGSQVAKRRANYQGGHSSLIEDNTSNATAVSYKNHQTARKISLQKTGEGDKFNTDFSTTIEMSGDNGHIRCNTIAIKSNGACNNILPGDDAYIGDVNVAHSIGIQSTSDRSQGIIYLGNRMDVFVGCNHPGGRLVLSSRWMDFLAPDGANFMGNIICRDGYEAGVTGFEAYRDGGHIRIAPANHNGAIAFEQFNSGGSAVGMRLIADGWFLRPNGNDGGILGYQSIRWQEIWCTRGAFNGSDSKLKENITPLGVGVARPHSDDIVTLDDLYNYVKEAKTYTFNYKKTNETMLGILADEIPRNIFNKIGVMSKTQEEYEEELKKKEELTEILSKTPMPLDNKGEENRYAIVEGTGLTYAELKEEVNKEVEEPMQLINAPSQVAMLQTVLSMAINKVDTLEQENQELKDRLDKLENLVQSIVNK